MNIIIQSSRWLNKGMDIHTQQFDDGYSCAVSIIGVEYLDNDQGGKNESVRYGMRLSDDRGVEYLCRAIPDKVVANALAKGLNLLDEVLIAFESEDNQPARIAGGAHSELRARVDRAELSFMEMKTTAARARNAARV